MIYLGSDHAGFDLKEEIKKYLVDLKYEVDDCGAHTMNANDDYPEYAHAVAEKVVSEGGRGILFCGSGVGVCVVANKVPGVRAAIGYSTYAAETSRTDDDTNVLCLAGRVLKPDEAKDIVRTWLTTDFSGAERYVRRLQQIQELENTK
ncbi:MAG: RpiB/LacA/LacB family sugar-phosphate isomerase [bacterium]|nr:RpiB/LacA/LacB family sugar-phosphate isomerase [bacterium]